MKRMFAALYLGLLASGGVSAQTAPDVITAVEFYDAVLDQYFITANADEASVLDTAGVWLRTGNSFNVFSATAMTPGLSPVCRLYGNMPDGIDLHFFSASPDECAQTLANAPDVWSLESDNVFQAYLPDPSSGACPNGTLPLFRSLNPANTDHRYTTDASVQAALGAQGWIAEGYGAALVAMCGPI